MDSSVQALAEHPRTARRTKRSADALDGLLTVAEVRSRLAVRDRRTALRLLKERGVPILRVGRQIRVEACELDRVLAVLRIEAQVAAEKRYSFSETDLASPGEQLDSSRRSPAVSRKRRTHEARARRGWCQTVERGLYRNHRIGCSATPTRKANSRCDCPFSAHLPVRGKPGEFSRQRLAATTLREARTEKARRQAEQTSVLEADGRITGDAFFPIWLANAGLAHKTKESYELHWRQEISPILGWRRLCDTRPEHILTVMRHLEERAEARRKETGKRNPDFIKTRFTPLASMMRDAHGWGRIDTNPAEGIKLPVCEPVRENEEEADEAAKILLPDELSRLYESAASEPDTGDRLEATAFIGMGAELGLRMGEDRGMRWPDFDFERGRANIRRQIEQGTHAVKEPKMRSKRVLPLSPKLAAMLLELRSWQLAQGGSPMGFVFPGREEGTARSAASLRNMLARLQRKAGLVDGSGAPLITPHGLRHTCASYLICGGMHLYKVSRYLGHSSVRTTEEIYVHLLSTNELDEAIDIFDRPASRALSSLLPSRAVTGGAEVIDASERFTRSGPE